MDFADLYRKHARDVRRFALFLCGSYALAEDLTAETFVRALVGREDLRLDTVKAYLFAIARNLYRDALRQERRLARTNHDSVGLQARRGFLVVWRVSPFGSG